MASTSIHRPRCGTTLLLFVLFLAFASRTCYAFVGGIRVVRSSSCSRSLSSLRMVAEGADLAAKALVKKAKLKEVTQLLDAMKAQGDDHVVNKYTKDGTRTQGCLEPPSFYDANFNRYQSVSVVPEYNKKSKTGFIIGLPPPEILGGVLREARSSGIIVSLDKRSGGATPEEVARFTKEQAKARIQMPIPIPIVWHDFIVSDVQILHAAAHGAAAITLYPDYGESLAAQITMCKKHQLEPIVMIKNVEEGTAAIAAGARCLCLHTLEETKMVEVRNALPDNNGELLYGARLRPEAEFSLYAEIDTTWVLRDSNFNFVWPSPEAVYATGMTDIYPTVLAMRSKASRVFLSPRQFLMDRRKEGAQEYLGDILY